MAGILKTTLKAKKVWTAPDMKKTSIEQITANTGTGATNDGHPGKS